MRTGIEKFKNVFSDKTCDQIVKYIEDNLDQAKDFDMYDRLNNVICQELYPKEGTKLDNAIYKVINKICTLYNKKYSGFGATGDTSYQLRKISGKTREHSDGIQANFNGVKVIRNISIIIGLNSDYEEGQFHFPFQDFTTTVKRGEAIAFPVYFMYPHSVDAPIGFRYTINTWMVGN